MQHLCLSSRRHQSISGKFSACQGQVRFFALLRIKPHAPPLVRAPSIHLSFNLAAVLPRRSTYRVSCATKISRIPTAVDIVLRRGLPGYLILFAPHAFAPQCQYQSRWSPSPLVFLPISRISPLHRKFHHPLPYSSSVVLDAVPRLSPGFHINSLNHLRSLYAQ